MEAFKSLEILIGVGGVMLLLSLLVTALTHMTVDAFRLRSIHLQQGVADLFRQLGWNLEDHDGGLATQVVKQSSVITREELVENLLEAAVRDSALKDIIPSLSGSDPKLLLEDLRYCALQVARDCPELSAASVKTIALARGQAAGLASEVFATFDAAMNRVSAKFTSSSRIIVCLFALLVALMLPLDTFDLFRRFSTSDAARAAAVQAAEHSAAGLHDSSAVIVLPQTLSEWRQRWEQVNIAGVFASALLLSLGAPFWFDMLKDLLRLRSSAAGQEERDRMARLNVTNAQTAEPVGGEKGDLNALGRLR